MTTIKSLRVLTSVALLLGSMLLISKPQQIPANIAKRLPKLAAKAQKRLTPQQREKNAAARKCSALPIVQATETCLRELRGTVCIKTLFVNKHGFVTFKPIIEAGEGFTVSHPQVLYENITSGWKGSGLTTKHKVFLFLLTFDVTFDKPFSQTPPTPVLSIGTDSVFTFTKAVQISVVPTVRNVTKNGFTFVAYLTTSAKNLLQGALLLQEQSTPNTCANFVVQGVK